VGRLCEASVSLEISFSLVGGDAARLEELGDALEADLLGIGEVVGWDLAGSTGLLIVGGEDQYEERLVADTIAKLSRAPGIDPHQIDILTINGATILSRRRMLLP
jgi:hypothetical protein